MSEASAHESLLRWNRLETARLAWAFVISIAIHLFLFGLIVLWIGFVAVVMGLNQARLAQLVKKNSQANSPALEREVPLMFVEVNPEQAVTEPPKNAKFYSDKSARAANPDAQADANVPKITGTQERVPKTEDVPRTKAFPLQPAFPAPQKPQPEEEQRPKSSQPPGDLAFAKPETTLHKEDGQAKQSKPRTLQEARARQEDNRTPGEKVKQEGGVKHRAPPAFDVKGTAFGAYDATLINAVTRCWYDSLDSGDYARDRRGKVVLQFHLNYDGRITDMKVLENSVGELLGLLCQRAVLYPAPYGPWPSDMRRLVGADYREVTFTFFYD